VYFNFGLIAAIGLVFPIGGYFFLKDQLPGNYIMFSLLSIALFLIAIRILQGLFRRNIKRVFFATILFIASIMCFGMPLAKTLTVNPEYTSLEKLNDWQEETNVEVYELTYFTPELIWAYGKPIEVLTKDGETKIPAENAFGVLVSRDDQKRFNTTFKDFDIRLIRRYDMNPKAEGERSHKPRLYRDLYLVTKP
jgi:hypothetical protein